MRTLKSHELGIPTLKIVATDAPGLGGASHRYEIWHETQGAQLGYGQMVSSKKLGDIKFQEGGIPSAGVNGVTHEALLAVVADRLESFQAGDYPSLHNEQALLFVKLALNALHQRTQERVKRGVEGQVRA